MATEIARLRAFLSLIVDAKIDENAENKGIEPLPNLDFKFVTANSLIDIEKIDPTLSHTGFELGISRSLIKMNTLIEKYFFVSDIEEKYKIREDLELTLGEIVKNKETQINSIKKGSLHRYTKSATTQSQLVKLEEVSQLWQDYKNIFENKPVKFFNIKYFFPDATEGFDIIIANPPFVRQERIKDIKGALKAQNYEVFSGTSDLYTYFYEKGHDLLKENGILTFISSNKWMRAKYGEKLRKFLKNKTQILKIIDFNGVPMFAATVDTEITIFKKKKSTGYNFEFCNMEEYKTENDLIGYIQENPQSYNAKNLSENTFSLTDEKTLSIKRKIEKIGTPLKDWDIKIYRGVLTGFNEAFIIDTVKRNEILANCETEEERKRTEEIIKPILRGRDIGRYYYKWARKWLIKIESGWTKKNKGMQDPEDFFRKTSPSLYNHFTEVGNKVGKGKGLFNRDDQGDYWWELRHCAYYPEFEKEKIVWQEISERGSYQIDNRKFFVSNTAYIMMGNNLRYLISALNSRLIDFYFDQITSSLSDKGKRHIKQYVELIPIPSISKDNQQIANRLIALVDQILSITQKEGYNPKTDTEDNKKVKELERQIDQMVYKLYDLTPEEIKIVEAQGGKKNE